MIESINDYSLQFTTNILTDLIWATWPSTRLACQLWLFTVYQYSNSNAVYSLGRLLSRRTFLKKTLGFIQRGTVSSTSAGLHRTARTPRWGAATAVAICASTWTSSHTTAGSAVTRILRSITFWNTFGGTTQTLTVLPTASAVGYVAYHILVKRLLRPISTNVTVLTSNIC